MPIALLFDEKNAYSEMPDFGLNSKPIALLFDEK